jgi:1-phosphatidylinositol-3-phosphate 5-kinase
MYFAKTMDDRFIVKQVTSTEKHSFLEFAPQYFTHLCDLLNSASPTCLAKILGIYTVQLKQGGKAMKELDLVVMENLFYGRHTTRLYDLKGSKQSRYNADASGVIKALLDQNMIENMPTAPIFVNNKAKLVFDRAVYNDTSFLAKVNVTD